MLKSSRVRLLLYIGLALLFNLRYVIGSFVDTSMIAYALGRVCGAFLLLAIIGEIIARIVQKER
jgi:hypothetical protein